jgi:hypothetical protein
VLTPVNSSYAIQQATRQDFVELLHLRVVRLGFFQDGDFGVGVFLEGEEIFVGGGIGIRRAFAQAGQSRAAVPTCASPLLRRGGRHYRET